MLVICNLYSSGLKEGELVQVGKNEHVEILGTVWDYWCQHKGVFSSNECVNHVMAAPLVIKCKPGDTGASDTLRNPHRWMYGVTDHSRLIHCCRNINSWASLSELSSLYWKISELLGGTGYCLSCCKSLGWWRNRTRKLVPCVQKASIWSLSSASFTQSTPPQTRSFLLIWILHIGLLASLSASYHGWIMPVCF